MTRFAAFSLLLACLSCLPGPPATAQPTRPRGAIASLRPVVVQLLPGDVVRQPLIGLDSVSYASARTAVALVPVSAALLAAERRQRVLADSAAQVAAAEVRRLRAEGDVKERQYQELAGVAQRAAGKPPARPLLLDWHTYLGLGAGAVLEPVIKAGLKLYFGW